MVPSPFLKYLVHVGYGNSFPPVSNPRRVTIVTKFFSIGTEPQHEPYTFCGRRHRVLIWDRSVWNYAHPTLVTATGMIDERIAVSASPSIETPSAPGRANVTGSGPAEK
jgi:hypothetical protein